VGRKTLAGRTVRLLAVALITGFLIWIFPGVITGCSVTLDAGQRATATVLRQYQTLSVCLPITAGTGYSWQIKADAGAAEAVETVGTPTFETPRMQPGARGHTRFVLRAAAAGTSTIAFLLTPPGRMASEEASLVLSAW
jgi:predicted secreted protein